MSSDNKVELTLENVLEELKSIPNGWPNILHALGIDRTIEIQIRSKHRGDDPGAMADMLRHWYDNYDYSWGELSKALLRIYSFKSNGAYIYNKYVNPECFTPEKISEELSFISDWFELAYLFLHHSDKIREVVKNTSSTTEKRVRVLEEWIKLQDLPSWEEIAATVEDMLTEHADIAKMLRKKYLPEVAPMKKKELPQLKPLDSVTAFDETRDIRDWFALGWFLGLPEENLLIVEEEHSRNDSKRQAILDMWMKKDGESANWLSLGKVISKMPTSHLGLSRKLIKRAKRDKDDSNAIKINLTAKNAVKEIGQVPWQLLLAVLDIDQSLEAQIIEEDDYPDNTESMERILSYWLEHYESTWETLARSLMSVPLSKTNGAYIYNKYVNPETFSIENVSRVLPQFKEWFQLAYSLFGDSTKLRRVFTEIPTKHEVLEYWMRHGYQPSWEKMAVAIESCFPEYLEQANSLRNEYLPDVKSKYSITQKNLLPKSLNSKSVFETTKEIKDWYALGWFLGIEDEMLSKVDKEKTDGQRQAILDAWLDTRSKTTSWKILGEAIRNMSQHRRLSERIMNLYTIEETVSMETEDSSSNILKDDVISKARTRRIVKQQRLKRSDTVFKDEDMESEEEEKDEDESIKDQGFEYISDEDMESEEEEKDEDESIKDQGFEYISDSLTDMKGYVGGIQSTVKRLTVDPQRIRGIDSALEEMKTKFDELKILCSRLSLRYEHVTEVEETAIQKRSTEIPKSVLQEMEIIYKDSKQFSSDRDYTFNWKEYGCSLLIKKGSIKEGEIGKVNIYVIYSGRPFHVPEDLKLVSSIYYISMSHDLLKPAILEIQHCCRTIYDSNGKCNLSFVSAFTMTSGPPYKFEPIKGGHFSDGDYGIIQRKGFSGYAIAFVNWVKSLFIKHPSDGPPQEKRIKLATSNETMMPLRYGMYYFLIAVTPGRKAYMTNLVLTTYLNSSERYARRKHEGRHSSIIVKEKFEEVKLVGNELIIDVSDEKESSELIGWKGHAHKIISDWEIMSESTGDRLKLLIDKIGDRLAPSIDINISWTGSDQPPPRSTFRIHYLGIQGMYSFPVTVPVLLQKNSSNVSERFSSFEEDPDDDDDRLLNDPPTLKHFLTKVAPRAQGDCDHFAVNLLQDTYDTYSFETKAISTNSAKYEYVFRQWEKEAVSEKFTWAEIIKVLNKIKNKRLAKELQDNYLSP